MCHEERRVVTEQREQRLGEGETGEPEQLERRQQPRRPSLGPSWGFADVDDSVS
jgi:hypothetical protein